MAALASVTVERLSTKKIEEEDKANGFQADEFSYEGHILQFENAKAWVLRTDTKTLHWVNVSMLREGVAIV